MYVCLCHGFTERHVKRALDQGAASTAGVYRALECRPQCGKCVPYVRDMVKGHIGTGCAGAEPSLLPATAVA